MCPRSWKDDAVRGPQGDNNESTMDRRHWRRVGPDRAGAGYPGAAPVPNRILEQLYRDDGAGHDYRWNDVWRHDERWNDVWHDGERHGGQRSGGPFEPGLRSALPRPDDYAPPGRGHVGADDDRRLGAAGAARPGPADHHRAAARDCADAAVAQRLVRRHQHGHHAQHDEPRPDAPGDGSER